MKLLILVVGAVCVNFVVCENNYKVAVVSSADDYKTPSSVIQRAASLNADILVLPPLKAPVDSFSETDNYDEIISSISTSAKKAGLYVAAHLYEKSRCQNKNVLIRSNLVFDRQGSIVAVYRKPVKPIANCTATDQVPIFTTDFGVTFGLLMEEDLLLMRPQDLKAKNFVVVGGLPTDAPFLNGPQFSSSWAYTTNANLVTPSGVFAGKAGFRTGSGQASVVKLSKDGGPANTKCTTTPAISSKTPAEDLSQYIIRPLDMAATVRGHSESVCYGKFCCDFFVKTSYVGSPQYEVSYGLAVFNGVRHVFGSHHIGAQSCSVVACAGLYKRSCTLGPNNSTDTHFEKITVSANFSKNSAQFPLVLTTSESQKLKFEQSNTKTVAVSVEDGTNLLNFGIFGRDYSKDFESYHHDDTTISESYYDYFFNEEVEEFFDYLWIRLRILFFVVSIYVLEMM